jgi:hypothetical protein
MLRALLRTRGPTHEPPGCDHIEVLPIKAHLHQIGRAIAATCDEDTLVAAWGATLGSAIFRQSRERIDEPRSVTPQRAKITLAKRQPLDANALVMLKDEVEDTGEPVEFAA